MKQRFIELDVYAGAQRGVRMDYTLDEAALMHLDAAHLAREQCFRLSAPQQSRFVEGARFTAQVLETERYK